MTPTGVQNKVGDNRPRAPHRSGTGVMTVRLALLYLVAVVYWIALSFVCGVVVERIRYEKRAAEVRERSEYDTPRPDHMTR